MRAFAYRQIAVGVRMNQCPVVLGLTLCEQVITDAKSRNVTLVNCFTHRLVELFPSEPISFVVFAVC